MQKEALQCAVSMWLFTVLELMTLLLRNAKSGDWRFGGRAIGLGSPWRTLLTLCAWQVTVVMLCEVIGE